MSTSHRDLGRIPKRILIMTAAVVLPTLGGVTPALADQPVGADDLQPSISGEALQNLPADTQIDVPFEPFITDGSAAPFDRTAAVEWALTHSQDPNPFPAACTWYVTQALWAGGIPQNPDWNGNGTHGMIPFLTERPGTAAATAVEPFITALLSAYPGSTFTRLSMSQNAVPQAQVGDVIAYDWDGDNVFDHLALITGFASGDYPLVSEWGTEDWAFGDFHPSSDYSQRGWTWSELHNQWLQTGNPDMRAALIHIDTTIPSTY